MKQFLLCLVFGLLVNNTYALQVDAGFIGTCNYQVSTYKYINTGIIKCLDSVKFDVSSFSGTGPISARFIFIKAGNWGYKGSITAQENCRIAAKRFEGSATIESKNVVISCDDFVFDGTLNCSEKCTIYTKNACDVNRFKRAGAGSFTLVVSPHEFKSCDSEMVCSQLYNDLSYDCLKIDANSIDKKIEDARVSSALNFLDEAALFSTLKEKLQKKVDFHTTKMHETHDRSALHLGLAKVGVTLIGESVAFGLFKNAEWLRARYDVPGKLAAAVVGIASLLLGAMSVADFYQWRNPQHKEKSDQYQLMIERLDNALIAPKVVDVQVIKL